METPTTAAMPKGGIDPQNQILQGIDVLNHPGQEVTAPERRQAGGCQTLESLVDLHPQVRQQPEGGIVANQALLVSKEST